MAVVAAATPAQRSGYELPSDEVERLLRSGEQPELLRAYFGDARYQELRDLARQTAVRAAVRGGPRVLIVPGILGSTLGFRHLLLNHVIWFNPVSLIAGEVTKLALNGAVPGEALDVVPYFYTLLKFRLWWFGLDADYYWYDWRRSIDDVGKELAKRVAREPAGEVHL